MTGRYFVDGCNDVGGCTGYLGCQSCEQPSPSPPSEDVPLRLVQRGQTWDLATADATREAGRITWVTEVPAGVAPGKARLEADGAMPVPVRVR